jgi:ketosteroid isomerase-like protein
MHYRLRVRFKPTDEVVETTICDLLTLQSGKIKEIIQFVDTAMTERLARRVRTASQ